MKHAKYPFSPKPICDIDDILLHLTSSQIDSARSAEFMSILTQTTDAGPSSSD
jgi:hypothetical protein